MGSKKSSRRSRLPLVLTLSFLVLSGLLYYFYQLTLNTAVPSTILELTPSSQIVSFTLTPSGSQTVNLSINPNSLKVTAAQLSLRFDPAQLGTPTLKLNSFFTKTLGEIKVKDGTLTFAAIVPVESGGKSDAGQIATLTFSRQPTAPTQITLTEDSLVAAVDYTTNVLKSGTSVTLSPPTSPNPTSPSTIPTSTPRPNSATTTPTPTQARPPATTESSSTSLPSSPRTLTDYTFGNTSSAPTPESDSQLPVSTPTRSSFFARFLSFIQGLFKRQ